MSVVYAFSLTSLLHFLRFLLRNAKMTITLAVEEQRLVNLYKCVNNINALQISPYVVRPTRTTRGQNSNSFIPISCNKERFGRMSVVYAFSLTSLLHLLRFLLRNAKMPIALVVVWSMWCFQLR
jgi:hypothetical protein